MKHNERLPDTRFGAGLLTRLEGEDAFVLPVRDAGAPSQRKRLDGQMGIVEDEQIKDAQNREGTEETVFVREDGDSAEIGVPETIRGTDLEHNLVRTYRNAGKGEDSPLPEADGVFYFEASHEVGEGMPSTTIEEERHETGYTVEVTEDVSTELMNDHVVDIGYDEIVDGDISVYDLEHMEDGDDVIHFDRPTVLLEPKEDSIKIFRGGELEYDGEVAGFTDFLSEEYDWNMDEVETPATAKVQARMDAYGDELGEQTSEEFVNDEYMEAVSALGEAYRAFPEP